jgi:type II secretory pathway component PulJ
MSVSGNKGYTVIETVVALFIGSMVTGFALSAFLFFHATHGTMNRRTEVESTAFRILHAIASDIERGTSLSMPSDSALVVNITGSRIVEFRLDGRGVQRNGAALHDPDIAVEVELRLPRESVSEWPGMLVRIEVTCSGKGAAARGVTTALLPWSSATAVAALEAQHDGIYR